MAAMVCMYDMGVVVHTAGYGVVSSSRQRAHSSLLGGGIPHDSLSRLGIANPTTRNTL